MSCGEKHDNEKLRWDLLNLGLMKEVVRVLTFGAKKYSDDNWKKVPNGYNRYKAALLRHLEASEGPVSHDEETGIHHMAHAVCCAIFMLYFAIKKEEQEKEEQKGPGSVIECNSRDYQDIVNYMHYKKGV